MHATIPALRIGKECKVCKSMIKLSSRYSECLVLDVELALEAACSVAVALYFTELKTLV